MKYLKTYENFKPIKINSHKPFKVNKKLDKSTRVLQKGVKSLKNMLNVKKNEFKWKRRAEINKGITTKNKKLQDLNFQKLKQAEYLRNNPDPVNENRYLKSYKLFENDDEDTPNLISILESPDFKPEDILKHIGLDEKDYEIDTDYHRNPEYSNEGVKLLIYDNLLENLMNIENGFISYIQRITSSYRDYEYYVDDDELNYIYSYLSGSTIEKIKELAKLFDYEIDTNEEGEIKDFFEYLGLEKLLDEVKSEISMENERAVEKKAQTLLDSLPFSISPKYSGSKKNLEIDIDYETIIEYMKKNKIEVKTLKELFENLEESSDFDYDFEYEGKYEFLGDFKDVNNVVETAMENYIDNPDDVFVKLIECDNLKLFKEKIDLANFTYTYDSWINYNRNRLNLFELAKHYNKSILQWFKSYEFQKQILEDKTDATIYKSLQKSEIINPKIESEFGYLVDADNYNL